MNRRFCVNHVSRAHIGEHHEYAVQDIGDMFLQVCEFGNIFKLQFQDICFGKARLAHYMNDGVIYTGTDNEVPMGVINYSEFAQIKLQRDGNLEMLTVKGDRFVGELIHVSQISFFVPCNADTYKLYAYPFHKIIWNDIKNKYMLVRESLNGLIDVNNWTLLLYLQVSDASRLQSFKLFY